MQQLHCVAKVLLQAALAFCSLTQVSAQRICVSDFGHCQRSNHSKGGSNVLARRDHGCDAQEHLCRICVCALLARICHAR